MVAVASIAFGPNVTPDQIEEGDVVQVRGHFGRGPSVRATVIGPSSEPVYEQPTFFYKDEYGIERWAYIDQIDRIVHKRRPEMPTFNHQFALAFTIPDSKRKDGSDVTKDQVIAAVLSRLEDLIKNDEVLEAVGVPLDTYAEDQAVSSIANASQ